MLREVSLKLCTPDEFETKEAVLEDTYSYVAYVVSVSSVRNDDSFRSVLSRTQAEKIAHDYWVELSSKPEGMGVVSKKQICGHSVKAMGIIPGSRLRFLQQRGRSVHTGLYATVG